MSNKKAGHVLFVVTIECEFSCNPWFPTWMESSLNFSGTALAGYMAAMEGTKEEKDGPIYVVQIKNIWLDEHLIEIEETLTIAKKATNGAAAIVTICKQF